MKEKPCIRCGVTKELSEYYPHKQMADGHLNKCKDCTKSDSKERYKALITNPEWAQKERDRTREKYHRLGQKKPSSKARKESIQRHYRKYPEKLAAKKAIPVHQKGLNAHHWSYNEEHFKDVILLKQADHYLIHRFIRYDQPSKMYRTISGELLSTRALHEAHINKIINEHNTNRNDCRNDSENSRMVQQPSEQIPGRRAAIVRPQGA